MKKLFSILAFLLFTQVIVAQTQTIYSQLKLNTVNDGTISDSLVLVQGTDKIIRKIPLSYIGGSNGLQEVLENGNSTDLGIVQKYDENTTGFKYSIFPSTESTTIKKGQIIFKVEPDGRTSLYNSINGSLPKNNLAYGSSALRDLEADSVDIGSDYNTAIGMQALRDMKFGYRNTALGNYAGRGSDYTIGSTIIGANAAYSVTDSIVNSTIIGNYRFPTSHSIVDEEIVISDGRDLLTPEGIGFRVLKDGTTTTPKQTQASYDADATGKAVVTKEVLNDALSGIGGGTPTLAQVTNAGNISLNPIHSPEFLIDADIDNYNYLKVNDSIFGYYTEDGGAGLSISDEENFGNSTASIFAGGSEIYLDTEKINLLRVENSSNQHSLEIKEGMITLRKKKMAGFPGNYDTYNFNFPAAISNSTDLTYDYQLVRANGTMVLIGTTAPSSATDTGVVGEIRVTSTYIYVCISDNTWVRAPLSTW